MPMHICGNPTCEKEFYSRHRTAKYCGRHCAGVVNAPKPGEGGPARRYTDDDLLGHLLRRAEELGRTPTMRDKGIPDGWTYRARFGSFNNAVLLAGLVPNVSLPPAYREARERTRVPLSRRWRILSRDGFRCRYCGGTPQEGYTLHVDHVVPISAGGLTTDENLVTACWLCNTGKQDS